MRLPVRLLFLHGMRPPNPRPSAPPYDKAARDATYPNRLRGRYRVCNSDSNPVVVKRTVNRNVRNDREVLCFFLEKPTRQAKTKTENNKYRNRTSKHTAFAYCVRHIKKKKTLMHWIPDFNYILCRYKKNRTLFKTDKKQFLGTTIALPFVTLLFF